MGVTKINNVWVQFCAHLFIVCNIIQFYCILSYKIICLICTARYVNNVVYIDILGTISSNERLEVIKPLWIILMVL